MLASRLSVLYAVTSALFESLASSLVKSSTLPTGQTTFLSNAVIFCTSITIAGYKKESLFPKGMRKALVFFSSITALILAADYKAMRLMPLEDEVVMSYTSIIFTIMLAKVYLKETCGKSKLLSVILIIAGVVLISNRNDPTDGPVYPNYKVGCALTLVGALLDASSVICIKGLSELHYSVILTACGCASMILTGPLYFVETWEVPSQPIVVVSIGGLTLLQDVCIFLAVINSENLGLITLLQASDIIFSYILEMMFFNEPYQLVRLLGASLVACGVCVAGLSSEINSYEDYKPVYQPDELPLFTVDNQIIKKRISLHRIKTFYIWMRSKLTFQKSCS